MKRPLAVVGAALTLLLSGGALLASSAGANTCPNGDACIWQDPGFNTNGNTYAYVEDEFYIPVYGSWDYEGTGSSAGNSASSVTNVGNLETATYYKGTDCQGASFSLAIQTGDGDLTNSTGNAPGGFDNSLSSTAFSSYKSSC